MSIFDKVKEAAMNQFIEVIEWLDDRATRCFTVFRLPAGDQKRRAADRSRIADGGFCF